jgi:hypothetical protein
MKRRNEEKKGNIGKGMTKFSVHEAKERPSQSLVGNPSYSPHLRLPSFCPEVGSKDDKVSVNRKEVPTI